MDLNNFNNRSDAKMEAFESDVDAIQAKYQDWFNIEGDSISKYYMINRANGKVLLTMFSEYNLPAYIGYEIEAAFTKHFSLA